MRPRIRAGDMNKLITLENPSATTPDGDGGFTTTYEALTPSPVAASIQPFAAANREQPFAGTIQGSASHIVGIRYHSQVTLKTRCTFGSRYLFVRGIENVEEANIFHRLACEEVVP